MKQRVTHNFDCIKYLQSTEKGASLNLRNSCSRCGRTKEAHEALQQQTIPPDQRASEWLVAHGLRDKQYFDLVRSVLSQYIREEEQ